MQHKPRQKTKASLIAAAQRLFAEKGIGAVSVKEITLKAGARNPSAVHYHFGNIEALITEVFSRRFREIEDVRMKRLAELELDNSNNPLASVFEAAIGPFFEACLEEDGRLFARFCIQLSTDPRFDVAQLIQDAGMMSMIEIKKIHSAILPDIPKKTRHFRAAHAFRISLILAAEFAKRVENKSAEPVEEAVHEAAISLAGFMSAKA